MKSIATLILCFLFIGISAHCQTAVDVTGAWNLTVQTDAGSGTPTFVLKQDGEKITGIYAGQLGEAPLTGMIKGNVNHIEFAVQGSLITYNSTASSTEMEGKVNLAEMSTGTFKGKKKV